MKAWKFLPLLVLASCVTYHDMYNNRYTSAGGDADVTFPGGGHLTHSHTTSLQHFFQFGTAVAGGIASTAAQKSSDALDAAKDANAAGVAKNAADNATKQLEITTKASTALKTAARASGAPAKTAP